MIWWADRIGTFTGVPDAYRLVLPPEISRVVPRGSVWWRSSFQASRRSMPSIMSSVTGSELPSLNVPSASTPTEPSFQPPAWAPITALSIPP